MITMGQIMSLFGCLFPPLQNQTIKKKERKKNFLGQTLQNGK
jgi:hypothetical protein